MVDQKIIVLFGGSGLIGRAVVEGLVSKNDIPVIVSRQSSDDLCKLFSKEIVDKCHFESADITDPESITKCLESVYDNFGRVDAVVNCTWPRNKNYGAVFEDVTYGDFKENTLDHIGGAFNVCQKAVILFQRQGYGNIINFSSIYGVVPPRFSLYEGLPMTKEVEYCVAKSSIIMLTEYLGSYLKGQNIRVNCISPGGILNNQNETFIERYNAECSNKGMLEAKDILGAILFLLSEESRYIQGHNLIVDDGFVL